MASLGERGPIGAVLGGGAGAGREQDLDHLPAAASDGPVEGGGIRKILNSFHPLKVDIRPSFMKEPDDLNLSFEGREIKWELSEKKGL